MNTLRLVVGLVLLVVLVTAGLVAVDRWLGNERDAAYEEGYEDGYRRGRSAGRAVGFEDGCRWAYEEEGMDLVALTKCENAIFEQ